MPNAFLKPTVKHNGCTWFKDVPNCAWERLYDWGYTFETATIGEVIVACETIIDMIETKDDYYFLDYWDKPILLEIYKEKAHHFLSMYAQFKGL